LVVGHWLLLLSLYRAVSEPTGISSRWQPMTNNQ